MSSRFLILLVMALPMAVLGMDAGFRQSLLLRHIEPAYKDMCRDIFEGNPFSFSQAWQDWLIFHNHFHDRLTWGDGFYIDFGANEPLQISNTLFFDKCLGWSGLCIEMQERYHHEIREKRGCQLVPHCVLGHEANVSVQGAEGFAKVVAGGNTQCRSIKQVMDSYNFSRVVDLMSIDVEGAEPDILKCWDFAAVSPTIILAETNKVHDLRNVDLFFHRKGYSNADSVLLNGGWLDNIYVKNKNIHKSPPLIERCSSVQAAYNPWCRAYEDGLRDAAPEWACNSV